jgi:hypothetical protein
MKQQSVDPLETKWLSQVLDRMTLLVHHSTYRQQQQEQVERQQQQKDMGGHA